MKRAWFSRRALVIIGTMLIGLSISVLLEDGMNFSGNPQGLFGAPGVPADEAFGAEEDSLNRCAVTCTLAKAFDN